MQVDPEAAFAGRSLEDSSSLIGKVLMLYMNNFFTISATRSIEFSDLGPISSQDASATGELHLQLWFVVCNNAGFSILSAYIFICVRACKSSV